MTTTSSTPLLDEEAPDAESSPFNVNPTSEADIDMKTILDGSVDAIAFIETHGVRKLGETTIDVCSYLSVVSWIVCVGLCRDSSVPRLEHFDQR